MSPDDRERRSFIRVPFKTETTVRTKDRTIRCGSSLDISMNGLRLAVTEELPPEGTACEIEIVLAESDPRARIAARGEIVRSETGILAVRLLDLDLDSYQHLRLLILHNADDPRQAEQEFDAHWGIRMPRSAS